MSMLDVELSACCTVGLVNDVFWNIAECWQRSRKCSIVSGRWQWSQCPV